MIGEIHLLHRSWLGKSIDLLLKACILPMTRARSAWAVGSRARLVKKSQVRSSSTRADHIVFFV